MLLQKNDTRPIYFNHSSIKVVMVNDVVLEGIIVRTWKYADDLLFHLTCYRILYLPQKTLDEVQDAANFVTIQTMKGNLGTPVVDKNYHVWVHGFLQSRDYESLFSILDGLRADTGRCYFISEHVIEVNTCDMGEDLGHTVTEVKIAFPMSHNYLTIAEEYIQW
jgi:hypothetical protein